MIEKFLDLEGLQYYHSKNEQLLQEKISDIIIGSIECDTELSDTSENPVQNKVIKAEFDALKDGTTPVGDSNKLGGKDASEYLLAVGGGATNFTIKNHNMLGMPGVKLVKSDGTIVGYLGMNNAGNIVLFDGNVENPKILANTAELANCLPLDGSKSMTGNLTVKKASGACNANVGNDKADIQLRVNSDASMGVYDATHAKWLIQVDANGVSAVDVASSTLTDRLKTNRIDATDGKTLIQYDAERNTIGAYTLPTRIRSSSETNLTHYISANKEYVILDSGNVGSYVTPANIGAAASDHTHTSIQSLGNYKFTANTLPKEFVHGLTLGFVNSDSGFGSYGTVITARGYSQGGGTLQLYAPYGSSYGGTHLKARFGDFGTNSGDGWTDLKTIAWLDDIPVTAMDKTKLDSYATPQQYGAVANGTTDDTAAFNKAIAAHSTVYIPSGKYKITTLTYPSNKKINFIIEADVTITQSEPASIKFVNGGNRQYYTHDTRTSASYNIDFNKINKMTSSSSIVSHNVRFQEQNLVANDKNFHWNVTAITDDYTVGTNGTGENVSFYSQMNSYSDGKVWAGCFEINERIAQTPAAPKLGIEITLAGGGTDTNYSRIGLDLSAHHTVGDGYSIGTGIRLAGALGNETFRRGIHIQNCNVGTILSIGDGVTADYGLDFRKLKKSIPVMLVPDGSYVAFNNFSLMKNTYGLNVLMDGGALMTVMSNGIAVNRPLVFNTAQMTTEPTNKTTPVTWVNVKVNNAGTLTDYYMPLYS